MSPKEFESLYGFNKLYKAHLILERNPHEFIAYNKHGDEFYFCFSREKNSLSKFEVSSYVSSKELIECKYNGFNNSVIYYNTHKGNPIADKLELHRISISLHKGYGYDVIEGKYV